MLLTSKKILTAVKRNLYELMESKTKRTNLISIQRMTTQRGISPRIFKKCDLTLFL